MSECPKCGQPDAYQGFNSVECPAEDCENFSQRQLYATRSTMPLAHVDTVPQGEITEALRELYNVWGYPVFHDFGD